MCVYNMHEHVMLHRIQCFDTHRYCTCLSVMMSRIEPGNTGLARTLHYMYMCRGVDMCIGLGQSNVYLFTGFLLIDQL